MPNFFAKRLAPNFLVLGVLEEVSIFQEVTSFVIKNCIGKVAKEINKLHTKLPLILLCTIMIDDGLFDCRVLPQQGRKRGG